MKNVSSDEFFDHFRPRIEKWYPNPSKRSFFDLLGGVSPKMGSEPQKWGPNPKNGVFDPPKRGGPGGSFWGVFGPLFSKVAGKSKGVRFFTPKNGVFYPQNGGVPPFWTKNAVFELKMSGFTTEIVILKKN